jgi:signal transduction histidine kinase
MPDTVPDVIWRRGTFLCVGLTICRDLVMLMGGELRLESMVSRGSTFSFTLALERPGNAEAGR